MRRVGGELERAGAYRLIGEAIRAKRLIQLAQEYVAREVAAPAPPVDDSQRITVHDGKRTSWVTTSEIDWIEAADYYAQVHAHGHKHLVRESLQKLEERLGKKFIRAHRSALVNLARIQRLDKLEGGEHTQGAPRVAGFGAILVQIMLLDIVFSLDSVITAVGMAREVAIMITAVVIAVVVMMVFAGSISAFIERHPTMKMLALSFLLLIGVVLIADGLGQHVSKGYIYFAMAFSLFVEVLNLRIRRRTEPPVQLHQSYVQES